METEGTHEQSHAFPDEKSLPDAFMQSPGPRPSLPRLVRILEHDAEELAYTRENGKTQVHDPMGTTQTFLSEIQFFIKHWDPLLHPQATVCYAGAAPGTHIAILSRLFPEFTFHLYNPSPFFSQRIIQDSHPSVLVWAEGSRDVAQAFS